MCCNEDARDDDELQSSVKCEANLTELKFEPNSRLSCSSLQAESCEIEVQVCGNKMDEKYKYNHGIGQGKTTELRRYLIAHLNYCKI